MIIEIFGILIGIMIGMVISRVLRQTPTQEQMFERLTDRAFHDRLEHQAREAVKAEISRRLHRKLVDTNQSEGGEGAQPNYQQAAYQQAKSGGTAQAQAQTPPPLPYTAGSVGPIKRFKP